MEGVKPLSRSATQLLTSKDRHANVVKAQEVDDEFKRFQEQLRADPTSIYYEEAKQESTRFRAAMIEWQAKVDPKHKTSIDFTSQTRWEDVVAMAEWAKDKYNGPEGRWGSIRKCFRKFSKRAGTTAPLLDGWMSLLPSQSEYASVICGGIKLIIGAAAAMNEVRDDIFDALEGIPQQIDRAERAVKAQRSDRLKELASDLYVAVIDVLWYILRWLNEKLPKRIFKPLLEQSNYGSGLKQRTTRVSDVVGSIKDEVQWGTAEGVEELKQRLTYQLIRLEKRQPWDSTDSKVVRSVAVLFEDDPRISRKPELLPQKNILDYSVTKDRLLTFLEVQTKVPPEEIQSLLDQDRAAWFMRSTKLREWLTSAKSQTLLVNGNCDHLETSPLASNCIRLLQSLEPVASIYTVHYFYNSNDRNFSSNYDRSAIHVLHSFIGQILAKHDTLSLSFLNGTDLNTWSRDLKSLCKTLKKLVNQLPSSVGLFCVLDISVSSDEPQMVEEMRSAILQLLKAQLKTSAILKVLITSPIIDPYSRWLKKEKMEIDDIVDLPEHVDDKRQCFDALRWDLNAGQILEEVLLQMSVKRRKRGG